MPVVSDNSAALSLLKEYVNMQINCISIKVHVVEYYLSHS